MNTSQQIQTYITSQPGPKSADMQQLHELIQGLMPDCRLWYLDGSCWPRPYGMALRKLVFEVGCSLRLAHIRDRAHKDFLPPFSELTEARRLPNCPWQHTPTRARL